VRHRRRSDCPISFALDCFGDQWTLLVVRDLLLKGKCRYQELRQSEEGIASNTLSDRLRALETAGIVERNVSPRNKSGVTYSLTVRGLDLAPLMVELILWSARHDPRTAAEPEFVAAALANRQALIDQIVAGYRPAADNAL
jgi:DNA-binding HxlR family transcriptional regulator